MQRVRTRLLGELSQSRCALVLGDGDGRFLAEFFRLNHTVQALAVDTSTVMLQLLRKRCLRHNDLSGGRLRVIQGSALEVLAARETDLVISHFFLDCLTPAELRVLAVTLAGDLAPGTLWLVSDFAVPESGLLRRLAGWYVRLLYAIFRGLTGLRVTQLPPIAATLQDSGFRRIRRCEFAAGMLYTELWQLGAGEEPAASPPAFILSHELRHSSGEPSSMDRIAPSDAQPNPEPPVPSLPEPDPGVFHHAPSTPGSPEGSPEPQADLGEERPSS